MNSFLGFNEQDSVIERGRKAICNVIHGKEQFYSKYCNTIRGAENKAYKFMSYLIVGSSARKRAALGPGGNCMA